MMGRMGSNALRNIRALVARDLADALRNPTALKSCGTGVLLAAFIATVVAGSPRLSPGEAVALARTAALCVPPAFAGCVTELYVMAEERERGMYLTLAEVGVTSAQLAVSKWLVATTVTLAAQALTCLLAGLAPSELAALLGLSLVAAQPLMLLGLACGLLAREQMASSLLAVPLTVVAVAPILAFMSDTVRTVTWLWPLGPAAEILRATGGAAPAAPLPALIALVAAWVVFCVPLAVWASRRLGRELAAERDRLDLRPLATPPSRGA